MLPLLRRRDFALLWAAGLVSALGDWMLFAALPYYVYERTGSALATGAMFIAQTAPRVLLGSVAGVFADRWDRRRTMIAADVLRAGLLLLLLAVGSRAALPLIYAVALLESAIGQFFVPARAALVPRLVGGEDLQAANALSALGNNLPRLAGPPIGGVLLAAVGLPGVVVADSASFLLSGLLVALLTAPSPPARDRGASIDAAVLARWAAFWREWVGGLQVVRRDRALFTLFGVQATAMVGQGVFEVLRVPFIRDVLGGDARVFGWLLSIEAVGALLGGLAMGRLGRVVPPARVIAVAVAVVAGLMLVGVNVPVLGLAVALFAMAGVPMVAWVVSAETLLQRGAEERYLGRLFGSYGTTTALATLGGMVLASAAGDVAGMVPLLNLAGGLHVAAAVLALSLIAATGMKRGIAAHG